MKHQYIKQVKATLLEGKALKGCLLRTTHYHSFYKTHMNKILA